MMLVVLDKSPEFAVLELIRYSNKQFVWKQLLELCQLICSAGFSDKFKSLKQGKKLQDWVVKNKTWVKAYGEALLEYCVKNIKLRFETYEKMRLILNSLGCVIWVIPPKTAIFRYKQGYECEYQSNSELDIDLCCSLYRDYIMYKFDKK